MLARFEQYVLECIEHEGTEREKLSWMMQQFTEEYSWRVAQVDKEQAMTEWLQGLCSAVNLPFTYHDIGELYDKWNIEGINRDIFLYGWFKMCAVVLLDMHRRHTSFTTWYKQVVHMTGEPFGVESVRKWIADNPDYAVRLDHTYFTWGGTSSYVIVSVDVRGDKPYYTPDEDYINGVAYNITSHH